jgi:hypothetical protein
MPLKTIIRETHSVEETIAGASCNVCGKVGEMDGPSFPQGFHIIRLEGGWGDQFPGDTEQFELVACEDCLKKWVDTFKHPDLTTGNRITGSAPYTVKHCEDSSQWIVDGPYIHPVGTELPEELPNATYPQGDYPNGVWEHFKGQRYMVLNVAQRADTGEHHVIYQALYGESDIWMRQLSAWYDDIDRPELPYKGLRFTLVNDQVKTP